MCAQLWTSAGSKNRQVLKTQQRAQQNKNRQRCSNSRSEETSGSNKTGTMSVTVSLFISIGLVGSVLGVCPNVISRAEWGAAPGETGSLRVHPASHVVLHHSETPTCTNQDNCMAIVRSIQKNHMKWLRYRDIGYNFLIGEDGNVYEGVGWGKMGRDNTPMDRVSIGICMIGDFTSIMPSDKAMTALRTLIGCGVERNHLSWDHRMVAHGQLKNSKCPGHKLYHHIREWPNWSAYP